ncbi:hypothetical protein [Streptomyces sp. NPDC093600]|uniref:hypothetical protein n=1 Tax=Streptomyces sp. NPDC093600 TaxID=3366047 RepID=UPI0038067130
MTDADMARMHTTGQAREFDMRGSTGTGSPAVDRSSGQAAHLEGLQDDGLIMAFVLPTSEVDEFVTQLKPEEPLSLRKRPLARNMNPSTPFSHLGLPEPDLLAGVREGQVCAPCEDNLNWLKVAVARVDDRASRVYLTGVD